MVLRTTASLPLEVADTPSKNRVGGFLGVTASCTGVFASQLVEPHQETYTTSTIIVSGRRNGNISDYIDETGAVVAHYEYDPFGRLVVSIGSMKDVFSFRFSTKYYEPWWGLYYYGLRTYSPTLGRFISRDPLLEEGAFLRSDIVAWFFRDPIDERGDIYLYACTKNDSINLVDFLGLSCDDPITVIWYRTRVRVHGRDVRLDPVSVSCRAILDDERRYALWCKCESICKWRCEAEGQEWTIGPISRRGWLVCPRVPGPTETEGPVLPQPTPPRPSPPPPFPQPTTPFPQPTTP